MNSLRILCTFAVIVLLGGILIGLEYVESAKGGVKGPPDGGSSNEGKKTVTVSSITPSTGSTLGGTIVTVTGENFDKRRATLVIGGVDALVTDRSSTQITAVTGPHTASVVDVVVNNPRGNSGILEGGFTYDAPNLTLKKTVINDNVGTNFADDWILKATDGGTDTPIDEAGVPADQLTATASSDVTANVQYTLSEYGGPSGYTATNIGQFNCSIDGGAAFLTNTITLIETQSAVCEIVNDDDALNLFDDVTIISGTNFQHLDDSEVVTLSGAAVFDYNNDGHQDIFVAQSKAGSNALYRNNGDMTFTDVASTAGVALPTAQSLGACAADYDNDGNSELLVTGYGTTTLFYNMGDGTFLDVSAAAGVEDPNSFYRSTGCAWGDYDKDGYLDVVIVRHLDLSDLSVFSTRDFSGAVRPLTLYHNNVDGTFTDMTSLLGDVTISPSNVNGAGFQPGWLDYDNDGDSDLYVVNDFGEEHWPNVLWQNNGDGTFTDVSVSSGANVDQFGMGLAVGDYDNDGWLDLYSTSIDGNALQHNEFGIFTDQTATAGVGAGFLAGSGDSAYGWGTFFFDYNNDGWLDLYDVNGFLDMDFPVSIEEEPNVLFENNGDGTFSDISQESGVDDTGFGRGAVYADFNDDGCLDIYLVNIKQTAKMFQNRCDSGNHWIVIKTVGTLSNNDGIGARIKVTADEETWIREVASGGSHMSQNMLPVHVGTGIHNLVDVEITWPSGTIQSLTGVAADQVLTVVEP